MARAHVGRPGARGAGGVAWSVLVAMTIGVASGAVAAEGQTRTPKGPPTVAPPVAAPPVFKPPVLLHFVEAPPPASLGGREEAEVVLTIDVDEAGHVKSVEVARSAATRSSVASPTTGSSIAALGRPNSSSGSGSSARTGST